MKDQIVLVIRNTTSDIQDMESRGLIIIKNPCSFISLPRIAFTHLGAGREEVFIGMCLGNLIIHE